MTAQRAAAATSASGAPQALTFEPGERVIVLLGVANAPGTVIGVRNRTARVKLDGLPVLEVSVDRIEREERR